jgi:2-methylcitrate dehydratase
MTTVVERISHYVAELSYASLPAEVVDYAKRIVLDSLGCLYGGLDSLPARIVRDTIAETGGAEQATLVWGGQKTSTQNAALANGVAIRYQDYNDVYFGPAWTAHPSDNLGSLLAIAEWKGRSGAEFLLAMIAAYEVQLRFSDLPVEKNLWHRGWHHTAACAYASAAGVSKLLGLGAEQTAHAIALAGARANTFAEIRHGAIPLDKALSAPIASSNALFCALLASRGFTGALTLLEGRYGFKHAVAGGADVEPLVPEHGDFRIIKVGLKPYPIEGMTPAMVQAALELREEHQLRPDEIRSIRIVAHEEAVTKPSWDAKKLRPDSKETADHSFYYCVAVALVAGKVTSREFEKDWLQNPTVLALVDRTSLEASPELTALFKQGARPAAVEVTTARGTFYREVRYPLGDPNNPMTWEHVQAKMRSQSEALLGGAAVDAIAHRVMALEKEVDMAELVRRLVVWR